MNKLSTNERSQIIRGLVEGNSIASLVRMTGIAKTTILRLVIQFGEICRKFHDERVKGLASKRVQMDEVWAFIGAKDRNATAAKKAALKWGDAWTWTAIDADTKLMVSWFVGSRDARSAKTFIDDVAGRLHGIPQITTDGLKLYVSPIEQSFGDFVDYAMLIKMYGPGPDNSTAGRYSPAECIAIKKERIIGDPDMKHVSTSFVERSNLTVRMGVRRYTRLTNGHSKKFANHVAMTSIFLTCYNWCRIHQTLRVTPAMEAGLTNRVWEIEELIGLLK